MNIVSLLPSAMDSLEILAHALHSQVHALPEGLAVACRVGGG